MLMPYARAGLFVSSLAGVVGLVGQASAQDQASTPAAIRASAAVTSGVGKRPVRVADMIEMTYVAGDSHYRPGGVPRPPLAYFSPKGDRFVIVLRRGNLARNTNDYSMLLFRTADALHAPKPDTVVVMRSRSPYGGLDAIRRVQWADDETIAFIGEDESPISQVYSVNVVTHKLERRTAHRTAVRDFRVSKDGRDITFLADGPRPISPADTAEELVITNQNLYRLLEGPQGFPPVQLFEKKDGGAETELAGDRLPASPLDSVPFRPHRETATAALVVRLEEDMNSPQKLYVIDPKTNQKALLFDLNPQFAELELVRVEAVQWKGTDSDGGGLYLPVDYVPGKRYPLVIQTHHFEKDLFMIDGPWSSGYAAQALASKGFVVLTVHHAAGYHPVRPGEAAREMAMYEGAIDYLDHRGLIDRRRVGILGFSRTVWHVAYTLTHSKYSFAAAILENGVDGGYWQYVAFGPDTWTGDTAIYPGTPWGPDRARWLKEAPGFNLDKVRTPVRLVNHATRQVVDEWEWLGGLKRLRKPVEMVSIQRRGLADHELAIPSEQRIAQQGAVDWFSYWLLNEEDPDPAKREQYARWHELRKQQEGGAIERQATTAKVGREGPTRAR